jgi:hypothetical protein
MKLLFENWRKYVNEADEEDDIRGQAGLAALQGDQVHSAEDEKTILKKAEELIEKYSLNSGNASDHRWGRGMPIVDYDFNVYGEDRFLFHATLMVEPEEKITQRDLQGEHELERRLLGILKELGLGTDKGLDNINFYDSRDYGQAGIHITYRPLPNEAWDLKGFESFLKRIRDISNKFEKFRIVDQLYKQGELDLEPSSPEI